MFLIVLKEQKKTIHYRVYIVS